MTEQLLEQFAKLKPLVTRSRRYLVFTVIMIFMLIYVLLVFRINALSSKEPTDDQVQSKMQTIKRPKVDEATLSKIQQLQDQNIQVKALFDQARQNPFAE